MDIVKQRRKRLMAWILAVVLCVGMWQGSVYATEGEGDGKDPVITEGSDESIEPQSVDPQNTEVLYNITINLVDENARAVNGKLKMTIDGKMCEWSYGGSGIYVNSSESNITADAFENIISGEDNLEEKVIEHNILGWRNDKGEMISDQKTLDLNKVSENVTSEDGSVEKNGVAYLVLGKYIDITYWEIADSSGGYSEQNQTENHQEKIGDVWSISSPESMYSAIGTFFVNWSTGISGGAEYLQGTNCGYDSLEFETKLDLYAQYTNVISEAKSYKLTAGTTYQLNDSDSWSVGDGYTYRGGQKFYVMTGGDYSFKSEATTE